MEKSIKQLDFETIDQMIQIHDYEGVSMMSRDANQKAAASEATNIFQNHYPEFLVSPTTALLLDTVNAQSANAFTGTQVLYQRTSAHGMGLLGFQGCPPVEDL